ncbi:hypothetical protein F2Q68_00006632 [Brassica cretica]|uniref:Uncharacterized protein n=1 Tax=Brassica cretica TaxID=69181 RepID=A0A8S9JGN7_BRACR|nr:hypothetical protein F2Q68_00006632 [Brassica cretica]
MTHYNRLSEISYNEEIKSWRFRVKIYRIYPFYSYVTGSGPHWTYILADEDRTKMEMTICGGYEDRFRGLEKQEGKMGGNLSVHIIDPLDNWLYMVFKNINEIPHMNHRDRNYLIDTMGVVFNTESHFDDPGRPKMMFYIRDNIESQIRCVTTGDHAYAFRDGLENMRGRGQVIVVLKMCRVWSYFGPPELWLETEGGLSDFRFNPLLPEVEEFRQSLLRSDPYVQRHEAKGPL